MKTHSIIIIGLGAVGSAVADALALQGHRPLAFDASSEHAPRGASGAFTRMIRRLRFEDDPFHALSEESHELWRAREKNNPRPLIDPRGALLAGTPDGPLVQLAKKYPQPHTVSRLDAAALARRLPGFDPPPNAVGLLDPHGGALNAPECIAALRRRAVHYGAGLYHGVEVTPGPDFFSYKPDIIAGGQRYQAKTMILCAGPWISQLIPSLAEKIKIESVPVRWFEGQDPRAPVVMWSDPSHTLALFPEPIGATRVVPLNGEPAPGPLEHPTSLDDPALDRDMTAALSRLFPRRPWRQIDQLRCQYTLTHDSRFVIDWIPSSSLMIVAACQGRGFKLAPAVAQRVVRRFGHRSVEKNFDWRGGPLPESIAAW